MLSTPSQLSSDPVPGAPSSSQAVDERLTELEIKASFSEDLLDELNRVVVRQQDQIDRLVREITALREQLPEPGAGGPRRLADDLPPHY